MQPGGETRVSSAAIATAPQRAPTPASCELRLTTPVPVPRSSARAPPLGAARDDALVAFQAALKTLRWADAGHCGLPRFSLLRLLERRRIRSSRKKNAEEAPAAQDACVSTRCGKTCTGLGTPSASLSGAARAASPAAAACARPAWRLPPRPLPDSFRTAAPARRAARWLRLPRGTPPQEWRR